MLLTRRRSWAERARFLSTQAKSHPTEARHREIGFNYRLTGLQAALGLAQLEQLENFLVRRRTLADTYRKALAGHKRFDVMGEASWARATYWTIVVRARSGAKGWIARLAEKGVESRRLWQPLHRSRAHRGAQAWRIEAADTWYREAFQLPCFTGMTVAEAAAVAALLG
jgi:perosamine synthetase